MELNKIGPGDEVLMVGRFINAAGRERNLPSVRWGHIAMWPHEPIPSWDGTMQEGFLVELHSKPGFSGAPVFVQFTHHRRTNPNYWEPYLLGIECGGIEDIEQVRASETDELVKAYIKSNTGMEVVIPAWTLKEFLQQKEFDLQRKKLDEKHGRKNKNRPAPMAPRVATEKEPLTKKKFEEILEKVSRRKKD